MRAAVMLFLLALPLSLSAGQFLQAYPAVYELVRIAEGDRQVLAGGELTLLDGRTERVHAGGDVTGMRPAGVSPTEPRVAMRITATRMADEGDRLDLESEVNIAIPGSSRRSEVPEESGSYIQGPQVNRVSFRNRTWQPVNDPTPVEVVHEEAGARYVLTILFRPPS